MKLKPDTSPICASENPELWFPDPTELRTQTKENLKIFLKKAISAIELCHICPLFTDGSCLAYAMEDSSTIDFGIWAGTLPMERQRAVGLVPPQSNSWEYKVRARANQLGIVPNYIPKRERPRSLQSNYLLGKYPKKESKE